MYDSTGGVESEAWSKRAVYLETEAEFELYDSVRVETHDNNRLYSEYLKWSQETDRITSPDFVTIITSQDSISGTGFDRSEEHTSELQSRGHLVCRLLLEKKN